MIAAIVRRPVSVFVATVAVCALGAFSLAKLPLSLLPSIERPSLVITARSDAAARDEMLHQVTEPIERRLPSVDGITSIESETVDGESRIVVGSAWQTDPDRLRIDVARRIEGAATRAVDELTVETAGSDVVPVIEIAVTGASGATRTRIAERVLQPELARIEGAGKIELAGRTPMRVTVEPRASALAARGLTAADVEERLQSVGRTVAAGRVREGASVRPIVVAQPVRTLDELRALTIDGVPLGEVADVAMREVPDDTWFRMTDGRDGVLLRVHRAPNANAVALARDVRRRVADLDARLGDVRLHVIADRSREVTRALTELALAAVLGVLLGTLILRWFLASWRPTLALAVVVPAALLASFTAFYAAGIPLDVISLAGLALATGLLVDNSIVVLESIETTGDVVRGTKQILRAVVASSVTLVVVFAPLLYLRGLARAVFGEQAVAVVASVAASLLLSLTLTPVLAQRTQSGAGNPAGSRLYLRLLDRASTMSAGRVAFATLSFLAISIACAWLLPHELFARGEAKQFVVDRPMSRQLTPEAARAAGARAWRPSMTITQLDGRQVIVSDRPMPGARPRASAFVEAIGGDARRVELIASAATEREAEALARRVDAEARKRGLVPVDDAARHARTAMMLRWDEARLAQNGVARAAVERDVRAALGDRDAGRIDFGAAEPEILLLPTKPVTLSVVPVRVGDRIVPLAAVAGVRIGERAPIVVHDEGRPARRLVYEGDATSWEGFRTSGSERLRVAGHARELRDAYAQLRLAALLAIVLLYLTIAGVYESLVLPLLVLVALPFAAGGGFVALLMTGQSLNLMSIIGLIFLGGVVVNHTVVLLDRAEQLRREGASADEAVRRAAADRYRPVMMTTLTAILGMLPLALLGGDGVELRRAVAIVVIGGLVTATASTLLVVPLLYRALRDKGGSP